MAKRKKREETAQESETAVENVTRGEMLGRMDENLMTPTPQAQQAQTIVLLDPYEIQAPVEANARRFQTPKETIVGLAMSMLEDGQQEPVKVAQLPDGTCHLVWGFRRWQAAAMINEEHLSEVAFELPSIIVQVANLDELAWLRLVAGTVENMQRVGLGPLDEAYAIQQMKQLGMNQSAIARKMGVSQATVTQRLKLLELPVMAQKRVNRHEVPVEDALLALGAEGDEREAAIKALSTRPEGRAKSAPADEGDVVEGDSGEVVKLVRPKTAKKMLAELEEYATPGDDSERTKAQVWLLTKLIPWVKNPKRKFQKVMEALEELA